MQICKAFDSFLNISTWCTRHPNDEQRFFCALRTVINHPDFHPDTMGEYMTEKLDLAKNPNDAYEESIDHYVAAAWAVKTYLKTTDC
jgi:hypothetical protein